MITYQTSLRVVNKLVLFHHASYMSIKKRVYESK